ncbi:hypothetical protein OHB39_39630 [Streptomyces sp. NBC_00047]|uniref:hypothetical protein n=1 Tax=Streptomyces sp. NBC_00047 TaxID=2975627 RepID=UPI0022539BEA|nr:hypothetical protein [Streptomyces sp. NBC_00047]MCX5613552.1 hypothetical protein [Streptomyces sp. NBC_00047]
MTPATRSRIGISVSVSSRPRVSRRSSSLSAARRETFNGTLFALDWQHDNDPLRGNATVLGYRHNVRSVGSAADESGTPGYVWAALDIKVCSESGAFLATTPPWTLSYADGARVSASSTTYGDFPKPAFPFETQLTAGKCVKGNIVFAVPDSPRPSTVIYAPQSLDKPREWTVPPQ